MTAAVGSRPYAHRKVKSEPSVTTVIGNLSKNGLDWAAAKLTAECAVYERATLDQMPEKEAVDWLRKYFNGIWQGRKYMGTLVHAVAEGWMTGEVVDIALLVSNHEPWTRTQETYDLKLAEATRYVAGLEKWWEDWEPVDIRTEEVVRTPGKYIGSRDLIATLKDGRRVLQDWKTTANQDEKKGLYPEQFCLQLAAYRYAREVLTYKFNADGVPEVDTVTPNEPVDACAVVHLRGDNDYSFFEVQAGPDQFDAFLALCDLHAWRKTIPDLTPYELGGSHE